MNNFFRLGIIIVALASGFECRAEERPPSAVEGRGVYDSRYRKTMAGRQFFNIEPTRKHNAWDMIKWGLTRKKAQWPDSVPATAGDIPPRRVEKGIRYTVVGHAAVLIQADGINILTDPIWSKRASMVSWAGPKRVTPPGIPFDRLPPIDVVLISHNHYDHLDIPTLRRLAARENPLVIAGLGTRRTLDRHGIDHVRELDWWQQTEVNGVTVMFTPARHFSRRGVTDYNESLWGGFGITAPSGTVCFVGDSGYGGFFKEIGRRLGAVDLAFIPIGAYNPAWMMETVHLTPEQAFQVHLDLGARRSVAIHFGTFQLTDEPMDEPADRLARMVGEHGLADKTFVVPVFGQAATLEDL
ncbi:MAG: MBL fold metallo-hydrolase [Thermodesulfobacteriota bacterium]|nr:MBL fold metallo-hydrolase [Thermodesulfobacteriota bacterium]